MRQVETWYKLLQTKVLVLGDRVNRQRNIILRNNRIEVLNEFKYLGVILNKNRTFTSMKKLVVEQAKRALFSLYRNIRNLDLSIECQLKLFDNTIVPVLTYGCEIWGFGDSSAIERVHTDFLKRILKFKKVLQISCYIAI